RGRPRRPAGLAGGVGEPDRRVAVRRPDLQDPRRPRRVDQDPEKATRIRSDVEHAPRSLGFPRIVGVPEAGQFVQQREEHGIHGPGSYAMTRTIEATVSALLLTVAVATSAGAGSIVGRGGVRGGVPRPGKRPRATG